MSLSHEEQVSDPDAYPAPPRRTSVRAVLGVALLVAVLIAGSGFALGWLWSEVAPRVALIRVEGGFAYADAEPEQPIAADGWFLVIGLAAGLLVATLAWTLRRHRGPLMLLALVAGSLGAAWIAWWYGRHLGSVDLARLEALTPIGQNVRAPLGLRITGLSGRDPLQPELTGVVAVQALAAAFWYTTLAGFSRYASLRGPDPLPLPPPPYYSAYPPPGEPAAGEPAPYEPAPYEPSPSEPDQFGPGRTGSSDSGTGTART